MEPPYLTFLCGWDRASILALWLRTLEVLVPREQRMLSNGSGREVHTVPCGDTKRTLLSPRPTYPGNVPCRLPQGHGWIQSILPPLLRPPLPSVILTLRGQHHRTVKRALASQGQTERDPRRPGPCHVGPPWP